MDLEEALSKRKTFAIVSHPDAGKTTLTEKFLLFGGAIHTAGAVKNNKIEKTAASDFMEIEKQRGISVATSVMAFEHDGRIFNLLDTPGHKDFAEDTYRTLTAVDSVIIVVDCVKGVEEQTRKLMEVCRMRRTPVIVFINKMDREGRDPYDLLDELEEQLHIKVRPLSWPIGIGQTFQGVYDLHDQHLRLFQPQKQAAEEEAATVNIQDLSSDTLDEQLGEDAAKQLREDVELIEGVYEPFEEEAYKEGNIAPVFFGSAVNNFGVKELLNSFAAIAPNPQERKAAERKVQPSEMKFSGFIFKIHANIDPKHRDRIAFLRVCSGKFERNKFYYHVPSGKKMKFSNPYSFMARSKEVVEEAWPGDVIGLYDTGTFKIGDTITEGESFHFKGIPSFSPENFKELINKDPMKSKQLQKGIKELTDEGVAQLFELKDTQKKVIGTVGELQFEVIRYRLENEYGARCEFRSMQLHMACWMTSEDQNSIEEFMRRKTGYVGYDKDGNPVFLARSSFILEDAKQEYPSIEFHHTSEFKSEILAGEE
ncbi:MAG: peptide chain release factor 3 [Flavobacteriales bacterium]